MRRLLLALLALGGSAAAVGWHATAPGLRDTSGLENLIGDTSKGETVFWAAGCAACHMAPGAKGADQLVGAPTTFPPVQR